jgi:hypothetical protein
VTREHRFFWWLSVAMLAATVLGFTRTYLMVPWLGPEPGSIGFTPLVHLHGVVALGWCLLFVMQVRLASTGRISQHRRLGRFGVLLYALLVVLGPFVSARAVSRYGSPPEELAFFAVSAGNVLAYSVLFGAALWLRRQPAVHKRLMVVGMVAMLSAPFGRLLDLPWQLHHVVGPGLFVIALAVWDVSSLRRLHPVTLYGGVGVLLWQLLPNAYMNSRWWLVTAERLVNLLS